MTGDKKIPNIEKAVLTWKDKGNEIIDRLNRDWTVENPQSDDLIGPAQVIGGDQSVKIDLSQWGTVTFRGCDPDTGEQFTFVCIGYRLEDV